MALTERTTRRANGALIASFGSDQNSNAPVQEKIDRLGFALARLGGDFTAAPPANYIFWLGAGFSKSAGIPLAEGVVDRMLDKRWRPCNGGGSKLEAFCRLSVEDQRVRQSTVREWAKAEKLFGTDQVMDWAATYGSCLHLLAGEVDRQEFIIECIEEGRGRLNMAHLLLGQLIKNHFVNTVLTTNFDDLLLRALQLYFVVPSTLDPDSTRTLLTNSRFVQVAYLHGRLASYRQRHTATEVRDSIPGFENYLTQALQDHGLVVIGYRGGEETPLHLLHKVLTDRGTGPGRGLFWVTLTTDVNDLPNSVREILSLKDCYWLPGWDADEFMARLCAWQGIGLGIPNPTEWVKGMETMLPDEARKLLDQNVISAGMPERRDVISAKLAESPSQSNIPWLARAIEAAGNKQDKEVVSILEGAKPDSERSLQAFRLWCAALYNIGEKEAAIAKATQMVSIFPKEPEAYQWLGMLASRNGKYEEAVSAFEKALSLGGDVGINLPLGIALKNLNLLDDAVGRFTMALEAVETPDEKATAYGWLGMTLNSSGKHAEAISNFEHAASIRSSPWWELFFWGQSLNSLGRTQEAEAKLSEAEKARGASESTPTSK